MIAGVFLEGNRPELVSRFGPFFLRKKGVDGKIRRFHSPLFVFESSYV
jgi:hypothetical protein